MPNWVLSVRYALCSFVLSMYQAALIFYRNFQHLLLSQRKEYIKIEKVPHADLKLILKFKR